MSEEMPDYGVPDEEFEWPEVNQLRAADAIRLLYDIETQASAANARAERLKLRKATARTILAQVLEREGLESGRAKVRSGRVIQYTPYDWDVFDVVDEEAFNEWAGSQRERFYDPEPKFREGVFLDAMRAMRQNGQPLPPGVKRTTIQKLNRTAVASKRKN